MSKGTPRITVRLCEDVRAAIMEELGRRNVDSAGKEPWKLSDWIIGACLEKLNHLRRGRHETGRWDMETAKDGQARPVYSPEGD